MKYTQNKVPSTPTPLIMLENSEYFVKVHPSFCLTYKNNNELSLDAITNNVRVLMQHTRIALL